MVMDHTRPSLRASTAGPGGAIVAGTPSETRASAMIHHIELYVSDLDASVAFWTPFMAHLGYEADRWPGGMNYVRGGDAAYLCLLPAPREHLGAGYHRKRVGLNHLAFRATSREQVDAIQSWAVEAGHTVLYADRYPYATAPGYYAAYVEDPDRIKVEVVAPSDE